MADGRGSESEGDQEEDGDSADGTALQTKCLECNKEYEQHELFAAHMRLTGHEQVCDGVSVNAGLCSIT